MVHGYHLIMPAYGFWLPNDPRGSWSDFVRQWELVRFGKASRTALRRGLDELTAGELAQRDAARAALQYPPVRFTGVQARAIGTAFAEAARKSNYTLWACAIMPEHTHIVIARHRYAIEQIANLLKGAATRRLIAERLHPLAEFAPRDGRPPGVWAQRCWKVFLNSEADIEGAIQYVEENPIREGKPPQRWTCVTPFAGLAKGWVTYHDR
jgi:REP element-mobilizing transposase RayT